MVSERFVSGFILPSAPLSIELSEIEAEIAAEKTSWEISGAPDQLTDELINIANRFKIPHHLDDPKLRSKQVSSIKSAIYFFGATGTTKKSVNYSTEALRRVPIFMKPAIEAWGDRMNEYGKAFKDAILPLNTRRGEILTDLTGRWQNYTVNDPLSFETFAAFLQDPQLQEMREPYRPFLQTLYYRSGEIFPTLRKQILENTTESPSIESFERFIANLVQEQNPSNKAMLTWLELLSFPAQLDGSAILDRLQESGIFPQDLRTSFSGFLDRSLIRSYAQVRNLLEAYKPAPVPRFGFDFHSEDTKRNKHGIKGRIRTATSVVEGDSEPKEERATYAVVLPSRGIIEGEQFDDYVTKTAGGFAKHDQRMINDIRNMLTALSQDPFGLGISHLTDMETTSLDGHHRLPLRRFRADQRIPLEHELSNNIRVVFYIDRRNLPNTVIVSNILDHRKFDSKYAS